MPPSDRLGTKTLPKPRMQKLHDTRIQGILCSRSGPNTRHFREKKEQMCGWRDGEGPAGLPDGW